MSGLHVRERGVEHEDAITFVLLHAGVADSRAWDGVADRLVKAGYRTIAPDLRGFGSSPDPTGDFRHADDVLALLDERGIDGRVVIVGWSMSGTIALELALDHPDRVLGVALVCSVPEGFERSAVVHDSWELEDRLLEVGDLEGAIRNDIRTWGAGPERTVDDLDPSIVSYMTDVARTQLVRADRGVGEALDGDRGLVERLDELASPVLVVTGDLDTPCHAEAAAEIRRRASDVGHVEVTGVAHMAPLEAPGVVADALATLTR